MSLLDFILNLVALLLWLSWRSSKLLIRPAPPAISISNAIKRTDPPPLKSWASFVSVPTLLILRAFFYWDVGPNLNWTASLDLVAIALPWRSDYFPRMLLYSFVSFGLTLGVFYSSLLLLSAVNRLAPDTDLGQKFVRVHLGFLERLPWLLKLLLPFLFTVFCWVISVPLLQKMGMVPAPESQLHLWEQALVLGISSWLAWRWLVIALLGLHLLNTYLYLGDHPFWKFVSLSARNLVKPLSFLQFGLLDLSAVLGFCIALAVTQFAPIPLVRLFRSLPL